MALLGLAVRELPIGTAYAVWTGIGAIGTVVAGTVLMNEPHVVRARFLHSADFCRNYRTEVHTHFENFAILIRTNSKSPFHALVQYDSFRPVGIQSRVGDRIQRRTARL